MSSTHALNTWGMKQSAERIHVEHGGDHGAEHTEETMEGGH